MKYEILVPEIRDDPENLGYVPMTDAEVLEKMRVKDRAKLRPLSSAELLVWSGDNNRLNKIEAAQTDESLDAEIRNVAKVAFLMIHRGDTKLDLNQPKQAAMFDALVMGGVFETEDKNSLYALATVLIHRIEELGLSESGFEEGHIGCARKLIAEG